MNNEHLKLLLKTKEPAFHGALNYLDETQNRSENPEILLSSFSEELAVVCGSFSKNIVKAEMPLEQLDESIANIQR